MFKTSTCTNIKPTRVGQPSGYIKTGSRQIEPRTVRSPICLEPYGQLRMTSLWFESPEDKANNLLLSSSKYIIEACLVKKSEWPHHGVFKVKRTCVVVVVFIYYWSILIKKCVQLSCRCCLIKMHQHFWGYTSTTKLLKCRRPKILTEAQKIAEGNLEGRGPRTLDQHLRKYCPWAIFPNALPMEQGVRLISFDIILVASESQKIHPYCDEYQQCWNQWWENAGCCWNYEATHVHSLSW